MKPETRDGVLRTTLRLLLALGLCAAASAGAVDYLLLHADPDGALLIDRDSIRRNSSTGEAWTLYRYDGTVESRADVPAHRGVRSRYLLDCKQGHLAIAERSYLARLPAGPAVKRETMPAPQFAPPQTPSERMVLATVCRR